MVPTATRLDTNGPVTRVEQERHHPLAPGLPEAVEHEQRVAWRGDRRPVVVRPALGELPHRGETLGPLTRDTVLAGQAGCVERAPLPPGNASNAVRDGAELRRRRRAAERTGEQLRLTDSPLALRLHDHRVPHIRVSASAGTTTSLPDQEHPHDEDRDDDGARHGDGHPSPARRERR